MLIEMEDYAQALGFDIMGVKMWIKVFWAENGKIDYIAYHLKPRSRNISQDALTAFLTVFTKDYEFPLIADEKYSNYSFANFPIVSMRKNNDKNKLDSLAIPQVKDRTGDSIVVPKD